MPINIWDHLILMWYLHTDVAISAPYGEDRSETALPGTVYIYAGAGTDVIRQTPIQVMTIIYTLYLYAYYVVC